MRVRTSLPLEAPQNGRKKLSHEISFTLNLNFSLLQRCRETGCDMSQIIDAALTSYLSTKRSAKGEQLFAEQDKEGLMLAVRRSVGVLLLCSEKFLSIGDAVLRKEVSAVEQVIVTQGFAEAREDILAAARLVANALDRVSGEKTVPEES
jgi:hypothetical protein